MHEVNQELPVAVQAQAERLRGEIEYYKARLADMRNAPEHSRHREGMVWAATQLQEAERQLEALQEGVPVNRH